MSEKEATPVTFENIFSSKGRSRILKVLSEAGELNISEIARRVELNYTTTNQHLKALRDADLVQEKKFGRIRIFRFKNENPSAQAIKNLIEFLESRQNINSSRDKHG
jgi:DNA-binding transcriptional ArsR family regulator